MIFHRVVDANVKAFVCGNKVVLIANPLVDELPGVR